jgi:hypothetical protein
VMEVIHVVITLRQVATLSIRADQGIETGTAETSDLWAKRLEISFANRSNRVWLKDGRTPAPLSFVSRPSTRLAATSNPG